MVYGGYQTEGREVVVNWYDIIEVAAGGDNIVGLKTDGTVVAKCKYEIDVSSWTDIKQISASSEHIVGLKSNGTAVAAGINNYGRCEVDSWFDLKQVSAAWNITVGLKTDGTVIATNINCPIYGWNNIKQVSVGSGHVVALKDDGTVVAVGDNQYSQRNLHNWNLNIETWDGLVYVSGDGECDDRLPCYSFVDDAYQHSDSYEKIKVMAGFYLENVVFERPIYVTLTGGWIDDYSNNTGDQSTIGGTLIITNGTVIVEGIVIDGTTALTRIDDHQFGCWRPEYRSRRVSLH